jgi:hypothetical protein
MKLPPQSGTDEQALLGALLDDNRHYKLIAMRFRRRTSPTTSTPSYTKPSFEISTPDGQPIAQRWNANLLVSSMRWAA